MIVRACLLFILCYSAVHAFSAPINNGVRRALSLDDFDSIDDVVSHVMDAFRPLEKDEGGWQFSNEASDTLGSTNWGCTVMLRCCAKRPPMEKLDSVGRLQPGAFRLPSTLERYLLEEANYRTFALLTEWKPVAPPTVNAAEGTATQQLLTRREQSPSGQGLAPADWEELQMTLEQVDTPSGPRWAIASLYKDYYGPTANAPDEKETSAYNWEMERNC